MKELRLSRNKVALVDDDVYEALSVYKWSLTKGKYTYYASRTVWNWHTSHIVKLPRGIFRNLPGLRELKEKF